jgi:hypothetical protein
MSQSHKDHKVGKSPPPGGYGGQFQCEDNENQPKTAQGGSQEHASNV